VTERAHCGLWLCWNCKCMKVVALLLRTTQYIMTSWPSYQCMWSLLLCELISLLLRILFQCWQLPTVLERLCYVMLKTQLLFIHCTPPLDLQVSYGRLSQQLCLVNRNVFRISPANFFHICRLLRKGILCAVVSIIIGFVNCTFVYCFYQLTGFQFCMVSCSCILMSDLEKMLHSQHHMFTAAD